MERSQTKKTLVCGLTRAESGHETGARAVCMYTAFPRLKVPKQTSMPRERHGIPKPPPPLLCRQEDAVLSKEESVADMLATCFLVEIHDHLPKLLV